ncbi:MAG: acetyl-CoA acetyltransferase [Candidatus Firestonebacteria bacterium RIFOXYC2_FULL_39_67]|nr:MAG: acetyl-CoA acetyltransferase [Candidatus Firestonebacteria bacterium RIFOXYD2_FULL_39_29]OGF53322.1 MAG: acetyl-CoA acetyltransferase [Candidatus Firestonebacteria bacterium RifOxyC12_full_39_7]OGF56147.1 MAG: acetyl-CoA acetyltransferase [Candidatus Firestonebacteria bacterium RIFOXYC2_FULL_39_67]
MTNVYIVGAKRSAIGGFGGSLSNIKITDVAAQVVKNLLAESSVQAGSIGEVIFGNVLQAGLGQNPARQVSILSGIPEEIPAFSVNKVCGSSLKSVALAAQSIIAGENDLVLAGGLESMSNAPYLLPKARFGYKMGNGEMVDSMIGDGLWDVFNNYHMGIVAENLVEKYKITREEQDKFSYESQMKAKDAVEKNKFKEEIAPVAIKIKKDTVIFEKDECPRKNTILEALAGLRPAFKKDGTVTAGNSSVIADGASAVILASEESVKKNSLKPLARIVGYASAGVSPSLMGEGVSSSVKKLLSKLNISLDKIDLFELNEAFASVVISAERELKFDRNKLNVNGGAIALGHPIGASGTRVLVTLVHEMKKRNSNLGLASLCIGGGMGISMLVEKV